MNDFKTFHRYQEQGHTCGPTCIQMLANFFDLDQKDDIDGIIQMCGCNTTTGTVDTGIKSALEKLKLPNIRNPYLGNEEKSMSWLLKMLTNGNIFVMRTLTKGAKHWIIVYGVDSDNQYLVADPWLGMIKYNEKQILGIWAPRDFDGFMVFK